MNTGIDSTIDWCTVGGTWLKTMMNVSRYRVSGMIQSSGIEAMSVVM